ncbi:MAG: bifunctional phosphoribosyl-AMP cyclohydrolase/phosphoribosyl-ATP diphosphatase HisIE [Dehalococcoidia bacterium]|nr:bifunctional phosphoribosyl-AMP cyclohydrolase/phosphoribosyl-ATP diphosphatase HisIE [Dehalococcoidia bacterium]
MLRQDPQGLIPAIAQDVHTGQVLMLGYMSAGALKRTIEGDDVWFYTRSREELWHKGEISGNYMKIRKVLQDCDGDTLLLQVEPTGPVCHTGNTSCFFTEIKELPAFEPSPRVGATVLDELMKVVKDRQQAMPQGSYTAKLFQEGTTRIAQKVIEEAGETALAAATGDKKALPGEVADLLYHTLVLLAASGVQPEEVWRVLRERHGGVGLHPSH